MSNRIDITSEKSSHIKLLNKHEVSMLIRKSVLKDNPNLINDIETFFIDNYSYFDE